MVKRPFDYAFIYRAGKLNKGRAGLSAIVQFREGALPPPKHRFRALAVRFREA